LYPVSTVLNKHRYVLGTEMGSACGRYGGKERYILDFVREI
jgi:hypothetical protein